MKYQKFLAFLFILCFNSAYSQVADTTFLSRNYNIVPENQAVFYRLVERYENNLWRYLGQTFYISGEIHSQAVYLSKKCEVIDGLFVSFYQNGNKKEEGQWDKRNKTGEWIKWHENGQIKEVGIYRNYDNLTASTIYTLKEYWDESGNQLAKDGTGEMINYYEDTNNIESRGSYKDGIKVGAWKGYYRNGKIQYEETISNGDAAGKSWDIEGNKYNYKKLIENPSPKKGMVSFYKFLQKNMLYPKDARKSNTQGKVFVQFFVDETGQLTNVITVKGIGKSCNDEAERVIKSSPKWIPGKRRGQPEKIKMILPITFKLG